MSGRNDSLTLPEWQDDDEVSQCPICSRQFGFLCRRHHCRRCGKVICAACSPHRITIPNQYIVRPPGDSLPSQHHYEDEGEDESNPALGGGETVRVCNPCVPDPNYGPPPQYIEGDYQGSRAHLDGSRQSPFPPYDRSRHHMSAATIHAPRRSPERALPDRYRTTRDHTSPTRRANAARTYYNRRTNSDALPTRHGLESRPRRPGYPQATSDESRILRAMEPAHDDFDFTGQPQSGDTWRSIVERRQSQGLPLQTTSQSRAQAIPGMRPPYPPPSHFRHGSAPAFTNLTSPGRTRPTGQRPLPTAPQEAVREEDECPVCGTTAPPFGRGDDQTARERHIEECITSHLQFSSPTRSNNIPHSSDAEVTSSSTTPLADPPPSSLRTTSWIAARLPLLSSSIPSSSTTPPPPASSVGLAGRPRASTHQQRMLVYHATEKDCHNDDGSVAECVICLEDFEVGDEMGRLECLCKFHRRCIRGWWESAGAVPGQGRWGSCPTHTLQS